MGRFILMNDVNTKMEENGLIVGSSGVNASKIGEEQSILIAERISKRIGKIKTLASSDAARLSKLIHQIIVRCNMSNSTVAYYPGLRERNFGVLTGTRFSINSDIFTHSRICAENGESIRQGQDRANSIIQKLCHNDITQVLAISHPFLCQIITNMLYGKAITTLTRFWFAKGSVIENKFHPGEFGIEWKKDQLKAYNLIEDKEYSLDEIYSDEIKTEFVND